MKLVVGLGNPGREYEGTRHNAGFLALDRLRARAGLGGERGQKRFDSLAFDARIGGERCLLLKPQTYMNRSGRAVAAAARFFKLEPSDVLVLVDDCALDAGVIRLRPEGSAGGHNGLADVERALGTRVYPRLRIGVDRPGQTPRIDYVLGRFTPEQRERLDAALDRAADCVGDFLAKGAEAAMSAHN